MTTLEGVNIPYLPFQRPAATPPRARRLAWACCLVSAPLWAQSGTVPDAATLAQVRQMLTQAATAKAPAGARIEVVPGTLDARLRLAPCAQVEPHLAAGVSVWGRTRVGLRCTLGATAWNVSLPVQVTVHAAGLVSTMPLAAGTVLSAEHVVSAEVDWAGDTTPAVASVEHILGRTLARPLAAGQALYGGQIKPRQWFAAGETVRIVARGPGFAINGEGLALSNGLEGQVARVRIDNGRVLSGQPVGDRQLEVAL